MDSQSPDAHPANRSKLAPPPLPETGADWCFFLDVDGTLLDNAGTPDKAQASPDLIRLLNTLGKATGGAVALITGRTLDSVDGVFGDLAMPVAARHGMDFRNPAGDVTHPPLDLPRLDASSPKAKQFVKSRPGLLFEDKGSGFAIHYQNTPHLEQACALFMEELAVEAGLSFNLMHGKHVVELKPRQVNKGKAIERLMAAAPFKDKFPVVLGDDATDEDGFFSVNILGGLSVRVGPGPTRARYRLADRKRARAWLDAAADRLSAF